MSSYQILRLFERWAGCRQDSSHLAPTGRGEGFSLAASRKPASPGVDATPLATRPMPLRRAVLVLPFLFTLAANPGNAKDTWKFDRVTLTSGRVLQGLVESEDEKSISFKWIVQNPGSPTSVISTPIARGDIVEIKRVEDPKERESLIARITALDPATERQKIAKLDLKPFRGGEFTANGLSYTSKHFVLISDAKEEIVRRAAFRLEQIYAAYIRYFPPRHNGNRPTKIILYRSLAEYGQALKRMGRNILNPALYDPERNEIICASEVEDFGERLEKNKKEHQQLLERLREEEAELRKKNRGKLPPEAANRIEADRKKIEDAERKNQNLFESLTQRLFQTLYHESFHAYLANFVYHRDEAEVPRWLNEGLAQIFETAILESGEIRVGHAELTRLTRAQEELKKGKLVSVAELLRSEPHRFIVAHGGQEAMSDRYYLASWAVAFYLTFDLHKLHSSEMTEYVSALKRGKDPVVAFSELVRLPVDKFEKAFHTYLTHLRPSGSALGLKDESQKSDEIPEKRGR